MSSDIRWKGFRKGSLREHYQKHVIEGREFGDISQAEYLKIAKEFAAETGAEFQETMVGHTLIKYDPATRRNLIGHVPSREIRTFYKADLRTDSDPFQAAIEYIEKLMSR